MKLDLWIKIMKEVKLKWFVGPFKEIPFEFYIQSPIGLVPKAGGDTRLIFHLSHAVNGTTSLNTNTPRELCTVVYNDFSQAVQMCIEAGQGCYAAKADMKSAFRNLPIRPQDWCLLVMLAYHPVMGEKWYFVDKCLPFGSSISCAHFQRFLNTIQYLFQARSGKKANN